MAGWRTDPDWHRGKAEWALYDAERVIYGEPRRYEAAIFINREHVDPATMTKAEDWRRPGMVEVFKFTVSQRIPTENYDYRFLTSGYLHADDLTPMKLTTSSQEYCGTSFREFIIRDERVHAVQHSYFPGEGRSERSYAASETLAFHDLLPLALRAYPFDATDAPGLVLTRVPAQDRNRATTLVPKEAHVEFLGREILTVPFGEIETHRLRVHHAEDGGVTASHYWFAVDPALRHVMVQYQGPYGVTWRLKRLAWWAYWKEPEPEAPSADPDH